jgi:hypothetical protein
VKYTILVFSKEHTFPLLLRKACFASLLIGTHHLLVSADDVNLLGEKIHTTKKYIDASKEVGAEVNAGNFFLASSPDCSTILKGN